MSMKRTWPISNSISFLISAGIQEVTLHYASFINLLLVQVSRVKPEIIAQFCRKYVVKLPLSAKRQNYRVIVFAQNHAVFVSESVRKILAIASAQARRRFSRSADRRGAGPRRGAVVRHHSSAQMMRREHAVQLSVAARQAPSRPPTLL